ncbi:hypothetical protein [Rhabdaerophilum sp. SD176]|uniref:hypothetical protein n=1 Tax=Rhabdaerophilum sp. SD176 TaxID=2983548 RepID=UPI0024DF6F76|nr:hypothetical protein [Rhabdaerophilum sp. SD176]
MARLLAEVADFPPVPSMTVEQALGQRRRASRLAAMASACWLTLVALAAGFSLMFARAARNHRAATTITVILSLVFSAWLAAMVLPEREPDMIATAAASNAAAAGPAPAVEPARDLAANDPSQQVLSAQPAAEPFRVQLAPPARDVWMPVRKPFAVYHVEAPEIEQAELVHRVATKDRQTRQDSFLWTNSQPKSNSLQRPAIHLVIERFENGLPTARPLFPDLARRAAEIGVSIERLQAAQDVMTKFGSMEVAEAHLASDSSRMACLAFRRNDTSGLVLAGWYCGTKDRPADRVSFVCFIDRIDLVGAGQDQPLRRLFAQAERQRKGCQSQRQPGRKITWLDHEAPLPALKTSQRRP